ncbi:MAG TPA: class I adenylate-forming enzyme family protein [Steroidobacteraceae bacterium]|nr:class I adenylate-forming enzyme family protein [Steroidobacteraceae bacterium]
MSEVSCLWDSIAATDATLGMELHGRGASVRLSDLATGSTLGAALESLRGRSVLIATREQLPTALALVELDGVAGRMVLCTPELDERQLEHIAETAQADAIVVDTAAAAPSALVPYPLAVRPILGPVKRAASMATEWILLTSGTTAQPKLVLHTLQSLGGALPNQPPSGARSVWSTFYDIRRYGGLQIYLRAVLSGSPLVLSSAGEPTRDFLIRAAAAGVTHISGTPSHWRRVLMSGEAGILKPRYVRLSGEVADQTLLDNLRAVYPDALIAHAFASTEAGVAFDVNDGLAGFPRALVDHPSADIDLKVVDHTLRIRSGRTAARYLGAGSDVLASDDGYVDTGDRVELVDGRYHFRGRMGGVINVGGLKVYPEEVEAVLNADPRIRMSLVRGRRSPITGAVVVADVVLANLASTAAADAPEVVRAELLAACRRVLAAHKVPATLHFVTALEFTASGKLVRPNP